MNHYTDRRLKLISIEGKMTAKRIAEMTDVSVAAISQWLNPLISKGVLTWCDEHGVQFPDVETLEKAKRSGKAYLKVNGIFGLPSPFELTGDERWTPGGDLFMEYDLELDDAEDLGSWNDADVEAALDNEDDRDKIIDFSRIDKTLGVNALSENNDSQNKNIGDNGGAPATCSEYSTERLTEELSGILSF
jgi:transcriptional regulator with XRE-family HTH domain